MSEQAQPETSNIDQGGVDEGKTYVCPVCGVIVYHAITVPVCIGLAQPRHRPRLMEPERSDTFTAERICECCEQSRLRDAPGWIVTSDGEDYCPECAASLQAELERMIAKLPQRIGLCPQCAPEFYYPLNDDEGLTCPVCPLQMIVYEKQAQR